MAGYSEDVVAQRSAVDIAEVRRLTDLGLLSSSDDGYTDADIRRVQFMQAFRRAGLAAEDIATVTRAGGISLEFIDSAGSGVFAAMSDTTFAQLSEETGIPVEQLTVLRGVTGGGTAAPTDLVRDDELEIVPLVQYQVEIGFSWVAIERALRVYGDSLRRVAEGEAEWWRSEIQTPMLETSTPKELARHAGEVSPRLSEASDRAIMAIYHAQQMLVWSTNIVAGFATALERAGLRTRVNRQPAMCFLDLAGFTQLTQERGDAAAAELAGRLNRIVERIAVEHRGRPVKWLGDGVMFFFPDPPAGVRAAIGMVVALREAGLPRAHVGLDSGPVVIQEGDYFGQTVNLAARIGEYARPGEVLVTRAVADASAGSDIDLREIGPVELKGVSGLVELYSVAVLPLTGK